MTGMKEGAGEDPFADDEPDEDPEPEPSTDGESVDRSPDPNGTNGSPDSRRRGRQQSMQIPYKFRRDGVQDGRDRVPLFLKSDTKRAERNAQRELEDRFDDKVSLTDLREALVKTGLDHLDEVETQLEEWGYGMTFSE